METMQKLDDLRLKELQKILPSISLVPVIQSLLDKGILFLYENLQERYHPKKEKYIFLKTEWEPEEKLHALFTKKKKAPKQLNILLSYLHIRQTKQNVLQSELLKNVDASHAQLNALIEKGIFKIHQIEVDRIQFANPVLQVNNTLNAIQQKALEQIKFAFASSKPVLLKGITGSGKTHIYFELIAECIANEKQVLYLLPEIALTTQIIQKLRAVFGDDIGIYHSRYSDNERIEIWQKTKQSEFKIIIGARSALLLPFAHLGLIIVDEEHDASYKQQDPAPRYHARDTALYLAHQNKANILLGSVTPSIESFYNCQIGKYELVELNKRFGDAGLPVVTLIDKKELTFKTKHALFLPPLVEAIQTCLQAKKQVILFQNRRGYAPYSMCATCGWIAQCKYCSVALTYHKHTDKLHCHLCGSKSMYIKVCAACGGHSIVAKSFGTEKVEEVIRK